VKKKKKLLFQKQQVVIREEDFLGCGYVRNVYKHPDDPTKVIKIAREDFHKMIGKDNYIDETYISYLCRNNKSLKHITKFYGWVDTQKGYGAVFDRIVNYDGNEPVSLTMYLKECQDSHSISRLVTELKEYLFENSIVFSDPNPSNILVQEYKKGKRRLVIIDGLGSKSYDLKLFITMTFPLYASYRVKKQWKKFLRLLKEVS